MDNNDVLRRLRYALNIPDPKVVELFSLAGYEIPKGELEGIFKAEGEEGYVECGDALMVAFFDGLVSSYRGRREDSGAAAAAAEGSGRSPKPRRLNNNGILKSIRVALSLKDDDIIGIMALAGVGISRSELSALFRKSGHPNYRPCGDQFLRNFLVGLTAKYRG